jgi:hypothetical protein
MLAAIGGWARVQPDSYWTGGGGGSTTTSSGSVETVWPTQFLGDQPDHLRGGHRQPDGRSGDKFHPRQAGERELCVGFGRPDRGEPGDRPSRRFR